MKPKIIKIKEPTFEQKKPPENIIYSYTPKKQNTGQSQPETLLNKIKKILKI